MPVTVNQSDGAVLRLCLRSKQTVKAISMTATGTMTPAAMAAWSWWLFGCTLWVLGDVVGAMVVLGAVVGATVGMGGEWVKDSVLDSPFVSGVLEDNGCGPLIMPGFIVDEGMRGEFSVGGSPVVIVMGTTVTVVTKVDVSVGGVLSPDDSCVATLQEYQRRSVNKLLCTVRTATMACFPAARRRAQVPQETVVATSARVARCL